MDTSTSIALITKYSTDGFDAVYKAEAVSSMLRKESQFVKFVGSKTVKIAKMAFGGLGNYYRNNLGDDRVAGTATGVGYQGKNATLTWEEHTISMDRAAKYAIEKFDDEESGGLLVGHALTEINRTQIIPEVDAYCMSKIFQNAGKVVNEASNGKPLEALNAALTYEGKNEIPENGQLIFMSFDYLNALRNTTELTKFMQQGDFSKDVSFRMTSYEGRKLVLVPPARFATEYVFGEEGYARTASAKDIDFIVMPLDSVTHVVKFQQTKILSGDIAIAMSNMDGFVILARIYHDVFVLDNKRIAIYAHTGWFTSGSNELNKDFGKLTGNIWYKDSTKRIDTIIATPGDVINHTIAAPYATSITLGTTALSSVEGTKPFKVGDTYDSTNYKYYLVNSAGVSVAEVVAHAI